MDQWVTRQPGVTLPNMCFYGHTRYCVKMKVNALHIGYCSNPLSIDVFTDVIHIGNGMIGIYVVPFPWISVSSGTRNEYIIPICYIVYALLTLFPSLSSMCEGCKALPELKMKARYMLYQQV